MHSKIPPEPKDLLLAAQTAVLLAVAGRQGGKDPSVPSLSSYSYIP